jgi:hypothetical protein
VTLDRYAFPVVEARETTVWMVHARTTPEGIKGTLRLVPEGVAFRPAYESGEELVFPLQTISRARRVRGSPVLELRLSGADRPRVVGFYFVRPPSLEIQQERRFLARGRAKRDAAVSLVTSNLSKKDEVARWVQAIRGAGKGRDGA